MTDVNQTTGQAAPTELDALKTQATELGIKYHPNIGADTLKAKIAEAGSPANENEEAVPAAPKAETPMQRKIRLRREASSLVRVRITCMNPAKREHEGEIFTAGNSVVGTFKKYVPFETEDGWHVPRIILEQIRDRQYQTFVTVNSANGVKVRKGKLVKEFAVDVLEPLSEEELKDLAQRQAMARGEG